MMGVTENEQAERQDVAAEQDDRFIVLSAIGVSGFADCGKLGESAKTA